ncbi:hypothetical protein Acr_09g0006600 [Actinidia rufa]|uniref:Uncharacterized protein n=1 Tax=Actinidia rufa TaxID=165716 RepID=A0A7J0F694_9ERIC|nr:hypothetical protein Acr_09g0006600 [Actinidia rufa]
MISVEESESLMGMLNSGEQRPMDETIMVDFKSKFPSSLRFRFCYSLCILLQATLPLSFSKISRLGFVSGFVYLSEFGPEIGLKSIAWSLVIVYNLYMLAGQKDT